MARNYGKLWFNLFSSDDFTRQPRLDKLLYVALIGQQSVNAAGITPLYLRRWARAMRDGEHMATDEEIMLSLIRLEERRYAFTDDYTGELLVRTFIRNDQVDKQPNVLKGAMSDAAALQSPKLAAVLLSELERMTVPVITSAKGPEVAKRMQQQLDNHVTAALDHLKTLSEGLTEPFPKPFAEDFPEGFVFPQVGEPLAEGFPEGLSKPPVVVTVAVAPSPSADGYVGRARAREAKTALTEHQATQRPPETCTTHPDGTTASCRACGKARTAADVWDHELTRRLGALRSAEANDAAELRAAQIASCELCDADGYRDGRLCSHDPEDDTRREHGMALVRAALTKGGAE